MSGEYQQYLTSLFKAIGTVEAGIQGQPKATVDEAIAQVHGHLKTIAHSPNKMMFVGNGGSAGIAGHMAIDFAKNGGVRSLTFNDASSLTCLGNDLGFDQVFAKQVDLQGLPGDLLIAISSSGESRNILNAVEMASRKGCTVVTLSGFKPGNSLRQRGAVNFYVASRVYGFVETAHQAILHAILDTAMGWTPATADEQPQKTVA